MITDPRACDFDPAQHLPICAGPSGEAGFSPGEIETLEAIYGGSIRNGTRFCPGQPLGAEAGNGWNRWIVSASGRSLGLWVRSEIGAHSRGRRGARLARREEGADRQYSTDK
ncbi:MAG: hypothetical protein E2P06_06745 [Acidobacteria bacterium]|nr:MAG: hypothetical protein E2P06_06745 [Acidobacteriota bacterium]